MTDSTADRFAFLAKPSQVLDGTQGRAASVACEAAKEIMRRSARQLIQDADGLPMLSSKSCDGTPLRVAHRSQRKLPSGKTVRTQGRKGEEFLVCNQFIRACLPGEGMTTKVVLAEPVPLTHGKAVPAILAAAHGSWFSLRSQGHVGISLEHYVWDRLAIKTLERLSRQWHLSQPLPTLPISTLGNSRG